MLSVLKELKEYRAEFLTLPGGEGRGAILTPSLDGNVWRNFQLSQLGECSWLLGGGGVVEAGGTLKHPTAYRTVSLPHNHDKDLSFISPKSQ